MSPKLSNRSFRPTLEHLEDRIQPSFILAGAVQQLTGPLNNIVTDMKSAIADVKTQHNTLIGLGLGGDLGTAEAAYGKGTADWQRVLVDQHAIQATVNADVAFIRAAAFAEVSEGDSTDAVLLLFGQVFNINPIGNLNDIATQANNLVNNDTTLQTDITTDFFPVSPLHTHNTFQQEATTPTF